MACLSGWIIALATLVGLLATAHMFWSSDLQITFVQFLTTVRSHTCEFSDGLLVSLNNYTGHTCWAFLHCVSSYDFWGGMLEWMNNWRTLVTLEGLLSTVRSHVAFQMTCLRGWIDALITLKYLFGFSPLCVLRLHTWAEENVRTGCICSVSHQCVC